MTFHNTLLETLIFDDRRCTKCMWDAIFRWHTLDLQIWQ